MNLESLQEYLGMDELAMLGIDAEALSGAAPSLDPALTPFPTSAAVSLDTAVAVTAVPATPAPASVQERLQEIDLAQKLGYLLCKCTWPPQIMVLSASDFNYRCPRCSRMRDM